MVGRILLDPLMPWMVIAVLAAVPVLVSGAALWRGLSGWALRGMGALVMLAVLANPSLQREEREPLEDIVLMVIDRTASQGLADRREQTLRAAEHLRRAIAARGDTELREVTVRDSTDDRGTLLMSAMADALAGIPSDRLAGVLLVSDGQVHDIDRAPQLSAPLHVLLTGRATDWDRRLSILSLPPFAILDEPVVLTVEVRDLGAAPASGGVTTLELSVDGGAPQVFQAPVGRPVDVPLTLTHGGMNTLQFTIPEISGELAGRNNSAIARINGVRDRLRVLLVSGTPHPGERTWRNLLKSDSSVDLVHFTILRPPEKDEGAPVNELSLIAFPTRELFLEKTDDFDLIIFDRYKRRGILPPVYLTSVRDYVERGGAVLFAAGPDFASADSLFHSDLADVIPAKPTARVIEQGFRPMISELGARHPVTANLTDHTPRGAADDPNAPGWGRWLRQIELVAKQEGQTVMTGAEGKPLLVLDRVGEGRVALLGSDHSWLWSRGFEGGGPQLELLRRLAHWMMKEPELEEEALRAEARGQTMTIIRQTLHEAAPDVTVTAPDGSQTAVVLGEVAPGRFEAEHAGDEIGLYRLSDGERQAVVTLGPSSPRELVNTIADASALAPVIAPGNGGALRIEDGLPALRNVRAGRPASGRGWLGLVPRGAYVTSDVTIRPVLPVWALLFLASGFLLLAWLREGRR